ncbi:MAG: DUF4369 domain-containing protein [Bacteroidales bacterium]|nr:DUF4369 domain-containing protein [Bacteroidales bacterium]
MNSRSIFYLLSWTIFALLLLLASCQSADHQMVISGELENGGSRMIRLARIDNSETVLLDSMYMKNGYFEFALEAITDEQKEILSRPMMYKLILSDDNTVTTMAQLGESIRIMADADNMIQTYRATGARQAELICSLDSALTVFVHQVDPLWNKYQQNLEEDSIREKLEAQYVDLVEQHTRFLRDFIEQHQSDLASYIAFYQSYNRRSFFNEQKDFALLKKLTESLMEQYPEHPYLQRMQQKVEFLESQQHDTD